jgi:hypothetical protein
MNVDFSIFAATTVPSAYYADMNPLHFPNFISLAEPITGYCPYLWVEFKNNSTPAPGYDTQEFIWNFGDYYSENITQSLTGLDYVEHIYRMPGKYTVSLTLKQTTSKPLIKPINVTTTKFEVIVMKDIKPQARIHSIARPVHGESPLTLEFTPKHCIPGSFPLERIDWDFGDGSPIKSITRQTVFSADPLIFFTDTVNWDISDVRNYDVRHIYHRTTYDQEMFYPSLTCYSLNTDSFDTCSTTIGPIFGSTPQQTPTTSLLRVRNTTSNVLL